MKAITILQPYASLIAKQKKHYETRGWATKYRGPIAIHAGLSKEYAYKVRETPFYEALSQYQRGPVCFGYDDLPDLLPYGTVIAIANLTAIYQVITLLGLDCPFLSNIDKHEIIPLPGEPELSFGDFSVDRYIWRLEDVKPINTIPARGMQRLWNWEPPEGVRI